MFKTTRQFRKYWRNRKIDWRQAYCNPDDPRFTINHPHRNLIMEVLKRMRFGSLIEVGCASGANLYRIHKEFPKVAIGGIDISHDAIETAKEILPDADVLEQSDITKIFLSDKSVDVVLSDMCFIYIDPLHINKAIKEVKRVARNYVVFLEFHSRSWWKRLEFRFRTGYHVYNWFKLLEKHGFYDVEVLRLSKNDWPDDRTLISFRHVIVAKL